MATYVLAALGCGMAEPVELPDASTPPARCILWFWHQVSQGTHAPPLPAPPPHLTAFAEPPPLFSRTVWVPGVQRPRERRHRITPGTKPPRRLRSPPGAADGYRSISNEDVPTCGPDNARLSWWLPALCETQRAAAERYDAAVREIPYRLHYYGDRTTYLPLHDGLRDPDPLELVTASAGLARRRRSEAARRFASSRARAQPPDWSHWDPADSRLGPA